MAPWHESPNAETPVEHQLLSSLPWFVVGGLALGFGAACGSDSHARATLTDPGTSALADLPETNCTVTMVRSEVSAEIATVGIVGFSTDMADLSAAEIQFGPDESYGLVAPVDLSEPEYRTLLLGMTENRTHHYRIAVSDGRSVCYGDDETIETGSLNSRALLEASTSEGAEPGFIVTARDGQAVIFDKEGELVWAYDMWNVFSAQLSWDGKHMLARDAGPFDSGESGIFYRVRLDGSDFATFDAPGGDHHDFAVLPSGIAYLAKAAEGECDQVYEASVAITDGRPVFDTWQIYQYFPDEGEVEGTAICHANRIHYLPEEDRYTVSDRNKDALAIFSREGAPVVSIGKAPTGDWTKHIQAQGAGPGGDWHVQHGHDLYSENEFVVFSNESRGGSAVLHYTIEGSVASLDWKYDGAGASMIQGDVERLANGNFLVTANLSGTIVEVGAEGEGELSRYVLGEPVGPQYGFTYTRHRRTLYGPPVSMRK